MVKCYSVAVVAGVVVGVAAAAVAAVAAWMMNQRLVLPMEDVMVVVDVSTMMTRRRPVG